MDDFHSFVDVHQHWWPTPLVELLAARDASPRIDRTAASTPHLVIGAEPPYVFDAGEHDLDARIMRCRELGIDLALQAPPCAIGIEWLPLAQSAPLFRAWHDAARELAEPLGWWAWTSAVEPDATHLTAQLADGAAGIVVPAAAIPSGPDRDAIDAFEVILAVAAERNAPLFVHPGTAPANATAGAVPGTPNWWPAMTDYVAQMHRAWYAWNAVVRPKHPRQRVVFALLAGLAPLHVERHDRRGAPGDWYADGATFFECSSYGFASVALLADIVGTRQILFGSDAPVVDIAGAFSARDLHIDPTAYALGLRSERSSAHPRRTMAL